jgi:TonB family protein
VAALLLHLLLLAVTWRVDLVGTYEPRTDADVPGPVEVVLIDAAADAEHALPRTYTSVPESQEIQEPPAEPDFLALRDSRAADRLPGGEDEAAPRADTAGELAQVAIRRDSGGSPGGAVVTPADPGTSDAETDADEAAGGVQARPGPDATVREGETPGDDAEEAEPPGDAADRDGLRSAAELSDLLAQASPSILDRREGRPGDRGFDYDQEAVSLDAGDLIQFGDFALSTVEWDFAPWLERFKQDFLPNWIPPYAYTHLGVIDGVTVLKMVVEPDGRLSDLSVLEEEGHESLHRASLAAVRATAPLAPLPRHFPDPQLVMTVKLIYSARR